MLISQSLTDYILSTESFSADPYKDGEDSNGKQLYSIGYGHQIQPNEGYLMNGGISETTATALFNGDIQPLQDDLDGVFTSQNMYDAVLDFGFNCGRGAMAKVIATWNATSDPSAVANEMSLYINTTVNGAKIVVPGLVARRKYETDLFNAPDGSVSSTIIHLLPGQSVTIIAGVVALFLAFYLW